MIAGEDHLVKVSVKIPAELGGFGFAPPAPVAGFVDKQVPGFAVAPVLVAAVA